MYLHLFILPPLRQGSTGGASEEAIGDSEPKDRECYLWQPSRDGSRRKQATDRYGRAFRVSWFAHF